MNIQDLSKADNLNNKDIPGNSSSDVLNFSLKDNSSSIKKNFYSDEELNKWKIIAYFFIGLFVGSLLVNFIPPFAVPVSVLKSSNLISFSGTSWIKVDQPLFNAYILTDKKCATCNPSQIEQVLRSVLSPTVQTKIIDLNDSLGKKLSTDFAVSSLPMVFFDDSIKGFKNFNQLEPLLNKNGQYYNLDISILGISPDIFFQKPTITQDHPSLGFKDAPLTIIEFIDYQCPFCKRFAEQTLPQIKLNYIDTQKVKIVFKDFPLNFHENANITAQAARCANIQGKFLQMHDLLFSTQPEWSNLSKDKIQDYLVNLASKISLNKNQFKKCLNDEKIKNLILEDLREGQENFKVSGTPSFLINNQGLSGALPYEEFQKIIDNHLKNINAQ